MLRAATPPGICSRSGGGRRKNGLALRSARRSRLFAHCPKFGAKKSHRGIGPTRRITLVRSHGNPRAGFIRTPRQCPASPRRRPDAPRSGARIGMHTPGSFSSLLARRRKPLAEISALQKIASKRLLLDLGRDVLSGLRLICHVRRHRFAHPLPARWRPAPHRMQALLQGAPSQFREHLHPLVAHKVRHSVGGACRYCADSKHRHADLSAQAHATYCTSLGNGKPTLFNCYCSVK